MENKNLIESINIHAYTVSEITSHIKDLIENSEKLNAVWIKGEISNLTYHSSGHIYFSLKDKNSVLNAVFFKHASKNLQFKLEEGMSVLAFGNISVFEKRGSYQLIVYKIKKEGIGELLQNIELLKQKLKKEGLFDDEKKKKIPFLPKRIGVVTSPTGAAFRDIIKVAMRRFPNIEIILAPAKVQGEDAPQSIVAAIKELNKPEWGVEVIIAGRGGGSFEDLMAFNDESVVRAFAESKIPIISAVGHQIDHPLSDEAADIFAPTPSAAAEIVIPVKKELLEIIDRYLINIFNHIYSKIKNYNIQFESLMKRRIFTTPRYILDEYQMQLADLELRINDAIKKCLQINKDRFLRLKDIRLLTNNILQKNNNRYEKLYEKIKGLSPIDIMKRGYSITTKNEKIVNSVKKIKNGDKLSIIMYDGDIDCDVTKTKIGGRFA